MLPPPASYSVKHYSNKVKDNAIKESEKTDSQKSDSEQELTKIKKMFPKPRVTLNELRARAQEKIFDIYYKQIMKKNGQPDWICTYTFTWPEKIKFESVAISKKKAAENTAIQALHWFYKNEKIDYWGRPIYDKSVIDEVTRTLKKDIHVTISENSVERINRIWNEYESEIKNIYEDTFREAQCKLQNNGSAFIRDSTIDEEDYSEELFINEDDRMDFLTDNQLPIHPVFGKLVFPNETALKKRERTLEQTFKQYYENLTPLPIDGYTEQITSMVDKSRVVVIVGSAGCGKSTRVPAAILKHCGAETTVIVSEPRRVAALGLAQRVADEMCEEVGESIGYQVRLQSKPPRPPGGAVLYCTSGVLLRRLQFNPGLHGCSHVIIDEAHERDVNTDITLLLLKRALDINPELKVIVMSATLDTEVFTNYFDDCPIIEVPGKTYPVEELHLPDIRRKFDLDLPNSLENSYGDYKKPRVNCQEIVEVIEAVAETQQEGAILVFLPGWAEIKQTKMLLDELYEDSTLHIILPVHSSLSSEEQTKMFATPAPGIRKIVLATNIAETSITIPDVVHVIDGGAQKENRINEITGSTTLETVWVSQAGAEQRAGRAGRVKPGYCYKMYTERKEMELAPYTTPEILRIPLEQIVLESKSYAPDEKVESFLSKLPEPPNKYAVQMAVNDLIDLGALTSSEQLTRLGALLNSLTLHPRLGRCVLNAAIIGCVLSAINVATHDSASVDLFNNSADRRDEIREIKRQFSKTSDHAAVDWIQDEFEQALKESGWTGVDVWCDKYGLRKDRLNYVKLLSKLHLEHLLKTGLIERTTELDEINRFSDIDELTSAVLLSGSNSLLVTKKHVETTGKLKTVVTVFTSKGERAHIASDSVNHGITKSPQLNTQLLTYFGGHHSVERRALVVHKTSLISPHTVLLFSNGDIKREGSDGETSELHLTKHNLKIYMPTSQAELILKAREMLHTTLQYYIERDIRKVKFDDLTLISRFKTRLVKALGRILVEGHKEYVPEIDTGR
ncbi:ATP-dependent RNA helicase DHX30-like [Melitaea cinxia]|uniref:ATP-dependent RNA helicase DHX30-like n=1 Tax=Melitaea cinxia TaxID=113334 RepID=UPI001E26FC23|nr:ATP-dependent RNA helicase DHX30-like [Melitaea cinxia]